MTSLYSHDITLVLFKWIIKQIIRKKKFVTRDWSQTKGSVPLFCTYSGSFIAADSNSFLSP